MAEYIDREKLKRKLIDYYSIFPAMVKRAIENAPTEEVVPRSEVEELNNLIEILNARNDDLFEENERLMRTGCQAVKQAKQEVASQVIDEFKNLAIDYMTNKDLLLTVFKNAIAHAEAELKKKYIGE